MSEEETKKIIDTIKQEEFPYALAIAKAYEKLEQENKKLKKYICKRNDCGGRLKENHKLTDSEVLVEFEHWFETTLENEKFCYLSTHGEDRYRYDIFKECLYKLQELKEGKNEKNND